MINRIIEFSSSGSFIRTWGWGVQDGAYHFEICTSSCQKGYGGNGSGDGQIRGVLAVATDSAGHVFVAKPQGDHGGVDPSREQAHRCGVAQYVR